MSQTLISSQGSTSIDAASIDNFPTVVSRTHSPRVFGLDLLRSIAILGVLFAHYFVVLYGHVPALRVLGHGGFYGVELFFVLSGFLIGGILMRSGSDFGRTAKIGVFYIRRWFRTLPLFWLFLIINILLEFFLRGHHLTFSEILGHGFFLRGFSAFHFSFFLESWSLAIEEWFYLLFPAALWLGLRIWKRFDPVFAHFCGCFFFFFRPLLSNAVGFEPERDVGGMATHDRDLPLRRVDDWRFRSLDFASISVLLACHRVA